MVQPVVSLGRPRPERADAVHNRAHLLATAREMIAEAGVDKVTMDGLAERAGLGKGTVFRRFGSRAGIFRALIEDDESRFQAMVLSGEPPLGPGADPAQRLVAFGRARIAFLTDHRGLARAAIGRNEPELNRESSLNRVHIRMLLGQAGSDLPELDGLAVQLAAALEAPVLWYLAAPEPQPPSASGGHPHLADSWQALIEKLLRPW